jgi:glutamate formiminotransferase / formiminotetrahydrofolate cyclodeaminase
MQQLVECVPNFSEGRDMEIIEKITNEIKSVSGVKLLNVDPGADTNRTVVTFVGPPDGVLDAAFLCIKKAAELIDMSQHSGAHPRMGATDVCPFIPVANISIEECVELANRLGERLGTELDFPIYLYSNAAKKPERKKLPDIRKGEYEALQEKLKDPEFAPDFGEAIFNSRSGATVVGVRDFMLAYNVNLNTRDRSLAHDIALNLRESGRAKRDKNGDIVRHPDGKAIKVPGKLKFMQGGGWYMEEYGYAQVTMNLHNLNVTGLHTAFEAVRDEASELGLRVTGSELIGMAPMQAFTDAGEYYLQKQGKHIGVSNKEKIHTAIISLGLNDTSSFDPQERVVEYAIEERENLLVDKTVQDFIHELSSDSPAPGGGSVSALSGALSAALATMVANLTYGNKEYKRFDNQMGELAVRAQKLQSEYLALIDADSDSFNHYMSAMRLPKKTDEDKATRTAVMQEAAKGMTNVPLKTLTLTRDLLECAELVIKRGNSNAASDAGVAALQAEAAAAGAYFNVIINLPSIKDENFKANVKKEADAALEHAQKNSRRLVKQVQKKL